MDAKRPKAQPSVFIETYGCQMNKNDSELVRGILRGSGLRLSENVESADVVLVNSCSVRDHAERRVLERIGLLTGWKKREPGRRIGVLGCMAQRLGHELLELRPVLDFVVGPDEYRRLPDLIASKRRSPAVHADLRDEELYSDVSPLRDSGVSGWVTISRGCGNFCSYCIVPYTRGPEHCRSVSEICGEVAGMADLGFREVTLLGQNVNSYRHGDTDFPDLIERVGRIPGLLRIRFMTSHPKDLSDRLLETMASEPKICPHIHLPVQSGSTRILERMNRKVTREHYLNRVSKAKERIPDVVLTTDVMTGFPGETEEDFQETLDLMEEVRFDEAFTYHYSPRAGTAAASMPDPVPDAVKLNRLGRLIELQRAITFEKKRSMIGNIVEVLPEKLSRRSSDEWMGKTPGGHAVVFGKRDADMGRLVAVRIDALSGTTLRGVIYNPACAPSNRLQTVAEDAYVAD
jgi:tRNA-2-methylthio-N6-dimethylallyladenosine synthase